MSSILDRRGFYLKDYPCSFGFVLIKAAIDVVSPALAELIKGSAIENVDKNIDIIGDRGILLWQYSALDWTIFFDAACQEELPKKLSEILDTSCIYFEYESVSAWEGYSLFIKGEVAETYYYGLDYREEMAEELRELGEEVPEESNENWSYIGELEEEEVPAEFANGTCWYINTTDKKRDYQFIFRSVLRSVSEDEVKNDIAFINDFFVSQDALLPSWSEIPDFSSEKSLEIPKFDFVRIDFINTD